MLRVAPSVVDLIGDTPLVRVRGVAPQLPASVEVYLKAEWLNPGGSIKDRTARHIVQKALADGTLTPGGTLLDSSSGNTGIAYAMIGAALGFRVVLCIPKNANAERQRTLRAYGAELVFTDPALGSDGAQEHASALAKREPTWFYANQYGNDANWRAHFETTGPELHQQTRGRLTHFIAALGTTGTCMGVGRYLREKLPQARAIAVQPDSPFHGLEGLKHLETANVPDIYDPNVPHEQASCGTERAYEMCKRLARADGLFIGLSAGAALSVTLDLAHREAALGRSAVLVSMGCDGGARYLSNALWDAP